MGVNPGYRSARVLFASKCLRAGKLAARFKVLQAAQFMISVLEMIPFAAARPIGVVARQNNSLEEHALQLF